MHWEGELLHIHIAEKAGADMLECPSANCVVGQGIEGDRYATGKGSYSSLPDIREITLIENETLEALQRDHGIELMPREHRRNLTTVGVPLNHLVGRRFSIGAVVLEGGRLNTPCKYLENLLDKPVYNVLKHRSGLNCVIVQGGVIEAGMKIRPTTDSRQQTTDNRQQTSIMIPAFTTRPEVSGTYGVVTSTHWLASGAGMAILEKGGNAFDAAVAAGFVLQVVEPHNCGPGGEVPIIFCTGGNPVAKVICGQGSAPTAATVEHFRALGLELVPGIGLLPAVVPGAFDAWLRLLRDYGSFGLREVLEPAIGYALNGYPLVPQACAVIEGARRLFKEEWLTSAAVYLNQGETPKPGELRRNQALGETYARVLKEAESIGGDREAQIEAARNVWYRGFVAETIESFCRSQAVMDTSGQKHTGLLTADDMASWQASEEPATSYDYGDYTVFKTGPWGQGPVFLQQLALLKGFDLSETGPASDEFVHTVIEVSKLAHADRDAFYADPKFVEVPMVTLLSDSYNDARRAQVGTDASLELRPGQIEGFDGSVDFRLPGTTSVAYREARGFGAGAGIRYADRQLRFQVSHGDTCHLDVIDHRGNMVSATPSGGWLQGSPVIPELGWGLNTRGEMFWLDESLPGSLRPGKRPRTTLTPTLAFKNDEPYLAFGTPGGDQQDQWSLHAFLRHVHFDMNLQAAIDAPEFHTKHLVDSFFPRECEAGHLSLEGRFAPEVIQALHDRGHDVVVHDDWSLGQVCAAARIDGQLRAAASPRLMQCYAVGR